MIGIEMKLRQYELGESFLDAVVERAGIDAISAAWESPEALPTLDELHEPMRWLDRTSGTSVSVRATRRRR